jgi:predicted Zn finger-like uncharacterized protein
MKITCHSCQSKYTIADDKVVGKVVKIRCKKCAAAMVVNGTDGSSDAAPPPSTADSRVESWTVNVSETDQRTMTKAEVVEAFRAGTIDAETFCWKEGMGEWLALRQIETLYEACFGPEKIAAAPQAPAKRREIAAHLGVEPAPASFGTTGAAQGAASARLAGGRAPTADLFGGFARAGGEDDIPAGPAPKMPDADDAHALTGARNETSVLFSLSALTGTPSTPPSTSEASGLIDIRQLSARNSSDDDAKKSRIEDIMNLSGGGAFSPTLVAPVLTAPILDDYSADAVAGDANASRAQKRAGLVGKAVGAGMAVVAVAAGTAIYLMADHGSSSATQTSRASAVMAVPVPAASQQPPTAVAEVGNPHEPAVPPATVEHEEPAKSPPATAPAETKPASTSPAALLKEAMAPTPHATPKAEAPSDAAPFNLAEARTRLSAAAAGASACKKSGGPTGTGHVVIVFAPNGNPQSVSVTGAPFSGTPTAACVAARFRAVRVPSFGGSPFSVSKSFSIN